MTVGRFRWENCEFSDDQPRAPGLPDLSAILSGVQQLNAWAEIKKQELWNQMAGINDCPAGRPCHPNTPTKIRTWGGKSNNKNATQ